MTGHVLDVLEPVQKWSAALCYGSAVRSPDYPGVMAGNSRLRLIAGPAGGYAFQMFEGGQWRSRHCCPDGRAVCAVWKRVETDFGQFPPGILRSIADLASVSVGHGVITNV